MSDTYPKVVVVHGSGGDAEYCAVTGGAVTEPYRNENFQLDRIDHAYETIRALCRNVGASSFTVKV